MDHHILKIIDAKSSLKWVSTPFVFQNAKAIQGGPKK